MLGSLCSSNCFRVRRLASLAQFFRPSREPVHRLHFFTLSCVRVNDPESQSSLIFVSGGNGAQSVVIRHG